ALLRPPPTSTLLPYTTLFRSKDGCTVTRSDFYPVASECYRFHGEVETVQWDDLFADNHPCRRSVVSDGIRKFDLPLGDPAVNERSEEHTSELQSLAYLVCRLL